MSESKAKDTRCYSAIQSDKTNPENRSDCCWERWLGWPLARQRGATFVPVPHCVVRFTITCIMSICVCSLLLSCAPSGPPCRGGVFDTDTRFQGNSDRKHVSLMLNPLSIPLKFHVLPKRRHHVSSGLPPCIANKQIWKGLV